MRANQICTQAEAKGATATEYGFVFGIYELTSFISCPIFGVYVSDSKLKAVCNCFVEKSD